MKRNIKDVRFKSLNIGDFCIEQIQDPEAGPMLTFKGSKGYGSFDFHLDSSDHILFNNTGYGYGIGYIHNSKPAAHINDGGLVLHDPSSFISIAGVCSISEDSLYLQKGDINVLQGTVTAKQFITQTSLTSGEVRIENNNDNKNEDMTNNNALEHNGGGVSGTFRLGDLLVTVSTKKGGQRNGKEEYKGCPKGDAIWGQNSYGCKRFHNRTLQDIRNKRNDIQSSIYGKPRISIFYVYSYIGQNDNDASKFCRRWNRYKTIEKRRNLGEYSENFVKKPLRKGVVAA